MSVHSSRNRLEAIWYKLSLHVHYSKYQGRTLSGCRRRFHIDNKIHCQEANKGCHLSSFCLDVPFLALCPASRLSPGRDANFPVFKCSPVLSVRNARDAKETLAYETETRSRHLVFGPRGDREETESNTFPRFHETETFENYVSRPSRDRHVETETTSLHNAASYGNVWYFESVKYQELIFWLKLHQQTRIYI